MKAVKTMEAGDVIFNLEITKKEMLSDLREQLDDDATYYMVENIIDQKFYEFEKDVVDACESGYFDLRNRR